MPCGFMRWSNSIICELFVIPGNNGSYSYTQQVHLICYACHQIVELHVLTHFSFCNISELYPLTRSGLCQCRMEELSRMEVVVLIRKLNHDDVIKWKNFPRYWPFVRGIHRSPVNSPHKGQWRGALMFTLICARINGWVNNREAGDLRRYRPHYDVTVMWTSIQWRMWIGNYIHVDIEDRMTHPCPSINSGLTILDPLYKHVLTSIPAYIGAHNSSKVRDEISHPFPDFNGATVAVWEWISTSTSHFMIDVITYPC